MEPTKSSTQRSRTSVAPASTRPATRVTATRASTTTTRARSSTVGVSATSGITKPTRPTRTNTSTSRTTTARATTQVTLPHPALENPQNNELESIINSLNDKLLVVTEILSKQQTAVQLMMQQSEVQQQQQQNIQQQQIQRQMQELKKQQEQQQQLQQQLQQAHFVALQAQQQRQIRKKDKKPKQKKVPKTVDTSFYSNQISDLLAKIQELLRTEDELSLQHQLLADSINQKISFIHSQVESVNASTLQERERNIQIQLEIQSQNEANENLERELSATIERLNAELQQVTTDLSSELSSLTDKLAGELSTAEDQLTSAQHLEDQQKTEIEELKQQIQDQILKIGSLETHIRNSETARKRLHNEIQELKGNVRVICRVRPLLGKETSDGAKFTFTKNPQELLLEETNIKDVTGRGTGSQQFPFKFDRVFPQSTGQQEVFEEIAHLVQSSLDGFQCCIFAYGQTGNLVIRRTFTLCRIW